MKLGTDPGSGDNAACALVDYPNVLGWWAWRAGKRGGLPVYVLTTHTGAEVVVDSPYDAAYYVSTVGLPQLLGPYPTVDVVLEGTFIARGNTKAAKGKRRSGSKLSEATGEIKAGLRVVTDTLERPVAQEWRRKVLGLPSRTQAHLAKENAVYQTSRHLQWPGSEVLFRMSMALRVSVAEAACMGCWPVRLGVGG